MFAKFKQQADLLSRRRPKTQPRVRRQLEALEERTLLTAGLLDPTFGVGGKVLTNFAGAAFDTVVQPDGKFVAIGQSAGFGESDFNVMRFNADGSPDLTFGTGGQVLTDFRDLGGGTLAPGSQYAFSRDVANDVTLQPDGKIVVVGHAGDFSGSGSSDGWRIARYNADGSLDTTFGNGVNMAFADPLWGAAVDRVVGNGGKIVVATNGPGATYMYAYDV